MVVLLYERGVMYRQIFMDGRKLPKDPNPTWMGYSVGRWEGDTLVVESAGFNDRSWLDRLGHPHLRISASRSGSGGLTLVTSNSEITYDDPKTLTRPLTFSLAVNYAPDTEMLETVCENERSTAHLVGKANAGLKVDETVLAKYVGKYQVQAGSPGTMAGFFGKSQTISLINGQLWMNAIPLIPQSETRFDSAAAPIEFFTDAHGAVTHLILHANEGEGRYNRQP